jgi:hypothetical protein
MDGWPNVTVHAHEGLVTVGRPGNLGGSTTRLLLTTGWFVLIIKQEPFVMQNPA